MEGKKEVVCGISMAVYGVELIVWRERDGRREVKRERKGSRSDGKCERGKGKRRKGKKRERKGREGKGSEWEAKKEGMGRLKTLGRNEMEWYRKQDNMG